MSPSPGVSPVVTSASGRHATVEPRIAGHALVEALVAQGVDTVFGVPGESYLAALDGFHQHRDRIRFVACRHEGGAAFMAEAQGKLTGRPGVCFVTRGPGATNASIGVHTAFQDSTPMLLLVGQVASDQRDREAFQEIDYRQMFGPGTLGLAKWVGEVQSADRLPEYVAHAFRVAMQGRPGPVVLALPEDLLTTSTSAPVLPRIEPALAWPDPSAMAQLRERLLAARHPFVIAGGGGWTRASATALEHFLDRWHLPAGNAFRFQDTIDNRWRGHAGDVGIGIAPALADRIREADLVIAIGARLGEMTTGGYTLLQAPRPAQVLVHLHAGPDELGRVYVPDLAIQCAMAAAGPALEALEPPLGPLPWTGQAAHAHRDWLANRESPSIAPMDPAALVRHLTDHAPADAVFVNGAGNYAGWVHRFHRYAGLRHHGRSQLAPTSGAMGYGLPAAVAASLLQPERTVIHFAGDGDFLMTSQEMATAMAHGAGTGRGRLVSIVVDNGSYGTIRMHQEREFPGHVCGTALANPDFVALARAYGWNAERAETTAEAIAALDRALAADRPTLVHVLLDADVITSRTTLHAIRAAALSRAGVEGSTGP
jgi:acetolactate synthase-1/2/3 large subunit